MASETPGNAWLNVVKIAKEEPLWFGKKGDVEFDYEASAWHQRHVQHFGSGSTLGGSAENEKMDNTPRSGDMRGGHATASPQRGPKASGATSEKKRVHNRRGQDAELDRPSSVLNTPRNTSWQRSYSAHSDPHWTASALAPAPLNVPSRPSSAHTATTARSASISYPGRLGYGTGIARTESGRETYLPDGLDEDGGRALGGRSRSRPSLSSRHSSFDYSQFAPRSAGKGY